MSNTFPGLHGAYGVIVADPPWDFRLWSQNGNRKSASRHYGTMTPDAIKALPVQQLADRNCLLLLWATGCMLPQAFETIAAWGFTYKSEIIWQKLTRNGKPRMGTGYRVRTMHEPILLATLGNPHHIPFPSIFQGVAREHSRKPLEFYSKVLDCTPNTFRCDLFARERHYGFDGWGTEYGKFNREETHAST